MAERAASTFLFVNANNSDNDDSSTFDSNDLATGDNQSRESDEEHASSYNSNSNENATSTCQQLYEKYGNSKKTLIAMCVGQKNDNGDDLVDFEQEPWMSFSKRDIKPTKQDYAREVKRRALIFQPSPMPRPSNWAASRSMEWLNDNPVTDENDVAFLKKEIARLSVIATRATISEENAGQPGNWRGPIPYLRLILCLIQDDIKPMYLRRADAITRQELDARNSEARPPTVFEKIAERWNDSNFNPQVP